MANVLRGMAAGLLAGFAASWAMNQFQNLHPEPSRSARGPGARNQQEPPEQKAQQSSHQADDATVQTAVAISRKVLHHELSDTEKQIAGPVVHYAYGSVIGAIYGGLAELLPITAAGLGLPFGFALWLLGDEVAVPALGLAKGPTEYPPDVHADALAAHLMYGLTTDVLRRFLKHVV